MNARNQRIAELAVGQVAERQLAIIQVEWLDKAF